MSLLDSLVAYWKLDEGTGTSAADATGNGHTGTLTGAGWATGIIDDAVNFTGATQYVEIPSSTAFDSGGAWAFWIKTSAATNNVTLISRISASGSADGLNAYITGGKLALQAKYGTNNALAKTGTITVNDGAWHYVVVNFSLSGTIQTYIDGVLDISGTTAHNWAFNSQAIRLGKALDSFWSQLVGSLDEIGIWSRALTSDEIASLYNSGAGLAYTSFGGGGSAVSVEAVSGSLGITGQTGSVAATANKTARASSGAIGIAGSTPTVHATANRSIKAAPGSIGITGQQGSAAASAGKVVQASPGSLSIAGQTGAVSLTANVSVRAVAGTVRITGVGCQVRITSSATVGANAGSLFIRGSECVVNPVEETGAFRSSGHGTSYAHKTLSQIEREKKAELAKARKKVAQRITAATKRSNQDALIEAISDEWIVVAPEVPEPVAVRQILRIAVDMVSGINRKRAEEKARQILEDEDEATFLLLVA